jgi:hypothetical protein
MYCYNTASSGYTPGSVFEAYQAILNVGANGTLHTFKAGSNFGAAFSAAMGGLLNISGGSSYTFTGAVNFQYTAEVQVNGVLTVGTYPNYPQWGNPGYCTAYKFFVGYNGVAYTQGVGVNFFPGSAPGQYGPGGLYV